MAPPLPANHAAPVSALSSATSSSSPAYRDHQRQNHHDYHRQHQHQYQYRHPAPSPVAHPARSHPYPPVQDTRTLGTLLGLWLGDPVPHPYDPQGSIFENPALRTLLWRLRPPSPPPPPLDPSTPTPPPTPTRTFVIEEYDRRRVVETFHPTRIRVDTLLCADRFLVHVELWDQMSVDQLDIRVAHHHAGPSSSSNVATSPAVAAGGHETAGAASVGAPGGGTLFTICQYGVRRGRGYWREVWGPVDICIESVLSWVETGQGVLVIDSARGRGSGATGRGHAGPGPHSTTTNVAGMGGGNGLPSISPVSSSGPSSATSSSMHGLGTNHLGHSHSHYHPPAQQPRPMVSHSEYSRR